MLRDDFSRRILDNVIEYRKTGQRKLLTEVLVLPQYFQKDILKPEEKEVLIDGGSYVGETTMSFIKNYALGDQWRVFCWEPDKENYAIIQKVFHNKYFGRVRLVKSGLWSKEDELSFRADGSQGSRITENGLIKVPVDSIDHKHKDDNVTFIKMDIEGAEIEALKGAQEIIQSRRPKLAICIYHRPSDLFKIPFLIKSMVPEYKLYMRHHTDTANETVIYATL